MSYEQDTSASLPKPDCHLDRVRYAELCAVRSLFPAGATVLEIGGGNGFQAAVLSAWGFKVTSIDIDTKGAWVQRYFDVLAYDGKRIPIENATVDVVFSSNVLEHVGQADMLLLFAEMKRVAVSGGIAVHIMPGPAWRFWTTLAHYPWLLARLVRGNRTKAGITLPTVSVTARRHGVFGLIKRILWSPPHGKYSSGIVELVAFRKRAWLQRFEAGNLQLVQNFPTGIFYTGYTLLPRMQLKWRIFLARILGSACQVYVVKMGK